MTTDACYYVCDHCGEVFGPLPTLPLRHWQCYDNYGVSAFIWPRFPLLKHASVVEIVCP